MYEKGIKNSRGFALPTVLIASTVMLLVLATTLVSVTSGVAVTLSNRHYNSYAKEASASGLAMAQACLKANDYSATWTDANPLQPNTNCNGVIQSSVSQYIHNADGVQSTFSVKAPSTLANGVQRVVVDAQASQVRTTTNQAWRTYTDSSYATVSGQTSFSNIAFGYLGGGWPSGGGAFFGVVNSAGVVSTVGYNGNGQLGNGTTSNASTPQAFILPAGKVASKVFANFLSDGNNLYTITTDGLLYGAGLNTYGQLGNGAMTTSQSTPVQFQLPAGVTAQYVITGYQYTMVIGSNNNIYSAGLCDQGALGYSYTIAGCTNQSTYKRVALPAVNAGNLNTLPVVTSDWVQSTNLVADFKSVFVRMQGGAVYGWGLNSVGQLGDGTANSSSTPVRITSLGDAGQAKAVQLAFDGFSLWILDDTGAVWATGQNQYGQLAAASPIRTSSGLCMDNPNNSSSPDQQLRTWSCNDSLAQQLEWRPDQTIRFKPDASTELCVDNANNSSANYNPIRTWSCNSSGAQKWELRNDGTIYNPAVGKCLDNPNNSGSAGTGLWLHDCNSSGAQIWSLEPVFTPKKIVLPSGHGKAVRITTDLASLTVLMEDGTVWSSGRNELGQLGTGNVNKNNPVFVQYQLPASKKAVDIYTTADGSSWDAFYRANTFAVLDDGSVYGAGSNDKGQLGTGSTSSTESTPQKMNLPNGVVAKTVQSGFGTTVILTVDGRIYTVGNNGHGQLGDGTTTTTSTPAARPYINIRPLILY